MSGVGRRALEALCGTPSLTTQASQSRDHMTMPCACPVAALTTPPSAMVCPTTRAARLPPSLLAAALLLLALPGCTVDAQEPGE